jgi:hypothetical protein
MYLHTRCALERLRGRKYLNTTARRPARLVGRVPIGTNNSARPCRQVDCAYASQVEWCARAQTPSLLARRLCLTRHPYAPGPTSRVERVCVGSPDGDRSPWRGDGVVPSARGTWDSSSTTARSELRCSSPYLGRPLLFLPSSPWAEILEPRHPEAPIISKSDTGVARLEEERGHLRLSGCGVSGGYASLGTGCLGAGRGM